MQLYVPGFRAQRGHSYQIAIGSDRSVDFRIKNVLIEYHPVRFISERGRYGDFSCRREYVEYVRECERVRHSSKRLRQVIEQTRVRLAEHYFTKRRKLINQSPLLAHCELVVASSPEEFYDRVLARFGRRIPTKEDYMELFYSLVRTISQDSRRICREKINRRRRA
jgi:hypothetical protein